MMKRVLSLLAVLLICAMCILPVAAEQLNGNTQAIDISAGDIRSASADAGSAEHAGDAAAQEDDMKIDVQLATTLIIVICSVLTIAILATVVFLARKNRS